MLNGKRLSGWMALAVFATVGGAMAATAPAFAGIDVDKLTIGGEIRERYEFRTDTGFLDTNAAKANESAFSQRVRVDVGYKLTPDVSFFVQAQDARIWGNETVGAANLITGVSSANNSGTGLDLHQGFIQLNNVLIPGLSIKGGRQEITFGDQRLVGNFNWSQIGIAFDGVRVTYSTAPADLDLFFARLYDPTTGVAAPAGLSTTGVIFPNGVNGLSAGSLTDDLYGAYLTLKPVKNWTIEPYYLLLKNTAATAVTANVSGPQASDQTRSTLGGRINGKQGGLDATVEADWQFGSISNSAIAAGNGVNVGANPIQDLRINAEALAARIGYTFENVPMKPRLGFEFDYASGEKCVNGNLGANGCPAAGTPGVGHFNTFDNLFPTNHDLYGAMDLQAWRNAVIYQGNFTIQPDAVSKLKFEFMEHRLASTTDNWYRSGQVAYVVTGPSNQAASLGQELDVIYWRTFKEKFKLELGFGHFFAGEIFKNNPGLTNGSGAVTTINGLAVSTGTGLAANQVVDQNWGYVMGSIKF